MGKTIMIVEDELKMRTLLVDYLSHAGYATVEAADGGEALRLFEERPIDLVILDIMMPKLDGYAVCRSLRQRSDVWIVLLTAKSEEYDKLRGYDLGADDYITKPFSPKVLVAKINALMKRMDDDVPADGFELIPEARELRIDGRVVPLSRNEFELLHFLYRHPNIALTREQILDHVWGFDYDGDFRTVDTHIKRLRQKLDGKAGLIATVKGYGYKLQVNR